jgi:hypothetical protein
LRTFPRGIFLAGREFVSHFTLYPRGQPIVILGKKLAHRLGVMHNKLAQHPRHGFHHHVIAILYQQTTHGKGARNITLATMGPDIKRDGAHERGPAPPPVL